MGEWSDWPDPSGPPALPDDTAAFDQLDTGGGYDPGGIDSGFSPGGDASGSGFDPGSTDYESGGGYQTGSSDLTLFGKRGGYSLMDYRSGDVVPKLGTWPPTGLLPGAAAAARSGGGTMDQAQAMCIRDPVLRSIAINIGKRISRKAVVRFLVKYGWQVAAAAFGVDAQSLMQLFVREKAKPKRRRGPHLYTVLKRIRAGHRYEKMLKRYAAKAHVGRSHASHPHAQRGRFRVLRGGRR